MERYFEIDFLRGIAILLMIVYHFFFDLYYLSIYSVDIFSLPWVIFARSIAVLFLFLVGISLVLNHLRHPLEKNYFKNFNRGLKIFSFGLLISFVTYLFVPEAYVRFGILHLIGVSVFLGAFFLRWRYLNLFLGGILIFIGLFLKQYTYSFSFLLWLGFIPTSFTSLDYFPLLPWFGVVLLGMFFGKLIYTHKIFNFTIENKFLKGMSYLGRHSLLIYLLHQPFILGVLYLLFLF